MSERTTDKPPEFWMAFRPDAAAGYAVDESGRPHLAAVIIYSPTAESLRRIKLTQLQPPLHEGLEFAIFMQPEPPSAEHVRKRLTVKEIRPPGQSLLQIVEEHRSLGLTSRLVSEEAARRANAATSPADLVRRPGEAPADFYRRIKIAHEALARITETPTTELARRAGVPVGTAAAWVSRAKAMDLREES